MTHRLLPIFQRLSAICGLLLLVGIPCAAAAEPSPRDIEAFDSYVDRVESRLALQHGSAATFLAGLAPGSRAETRLRCGETIVEQLTPAGGLSLPGALLHHWRGSAFVPGATASDFERLMQNLDGYPHYFAPQVLQARVLSRNGNRLQASMRIVQHHVLTVTMDSTYDIVYTRLDAQHGYSLSHSTRISEIDAPGSSAERVLSAAREHGYLWRLNTYWSYEERDRGLYIQMETVSLTRSIPAGLGWAISPFVESIPRESLEFTLRAACNALWKPSFGGKQFAQSYGTGRRSPITCQ
jgi:hypothetical protein